MAKMMREYFEEMGEPGNIPKLKHLCPVVIYKDLVCKVTSTTRPMLYEA